MHYDPNPVPDEIRQRVEQASSIAFVDGIMKDVLHQQYPALATIEKIQRLKHKRRKGVHHSTFIYSYIFSGTTVDGSPFVKHLVYSAHTDDSRLRNYTNLHLLIDNGFNTGPYRVIVPVEYIENLHALIYEGVPGKTILEYLRKQLPPLDLTNLMVQTAQWAAKFHQFAVPTVALKNVQAFDPLATSFALAQLQSRVTTNSQEQGEKLHHFIVAFAKLEQSLRVTYTPSLVYGDLHPENVITRDLQAQNLTVIDFTDISVGDQLRDVGTFLQQFNFMARNFYEATAVQQLRTTFLESYFKQPLATIPINSLVRINLYQAWNSLRGFTWLYFGDDPQRLPYGLLEDAWLYLSLAIEQQRSITIQYK